MLLLLLLRQVSSALNWITALYAFIMHMFIATYSYTWARRQVCVGGAAAGAFAFGLMVEGRGRRAWGLDCGGWYEREGSSSGGV